MKDFQYSVVVAATFSFHLVVSRIALLPISLNKI